MSVSTNWCYPAVWLLRSVGTRLEWAGIGSVLKHYLLLTGAFIMTQSALQTASLPDPESDGMFAVAVANHLRGEMVKLIEKHCRIVPKRLWYLLDDSIAGFSFNIKPDDFSDSASVPDLYGDEAYLAFVASSLEGEKPNASAANS